MHVAVAPHLEQVDIWPNSGKQILARYDAETVLLHQAYNRVIGQYALEHGALGGAFSHSRTSWVKPNFLWMMFRSGWGTKPDQEVGSGCAARRMKRSAGGSSWRCTT
jgi:hypothetical protein